MLRVITATSAAARLERRGGLPRRIVPPPLKSSSSARRAARPTISRARSHVGRERRFGLMRFSLTELAARAAAARLAGASRAPLTQAGAEATAARVVFDALGAEELEYFVAGRLDARLSQGARADASRAAPGRDRTRPLMAPSADPALRRRLRRRDATSGACWLVSKDKWTARLSATAPRCFTSQPTPAAPGRCDGRGSRSCCSTFRSTREPSGSLRRRSSRARPTLCATVPEGDECAREAWAGLGVTVEAVAIRRKARAIWPVCAVTCSRWIGPRNENAQATSGCFPRRARAARRSRSCGASWTKPRAACRSTRWRSSFAHRSSISGCSSTPAREAACPVYFDRGTRRPDPAGRAFVALLSCAVEGLSAKRFDEYLSLGQVPRSQSWADAGSPTTGTPSRSNVLAPATRCGRGPLAPRARIGELSGRCRRRTPIRAGDAAPPIDSDDEAVVAGTLRSPWKWEELIVESAVVGGRSRRMARRGGAAGSTGLRPTIEYRIDELETGRARIAAHRAVRARPAEPVAPPRSSPCPIIEELAGWPERGDLGRVARSVFGARRARAARDPIACLQPARRAAADGRRRAGHASRRRATCCTIAS